MNPPGKALKNGRPSAPRPPSIQSGTAPVFRILGILLFVLGIAVAGLWFVYKEAVIIYASGGCLFWSALMFALAEALARLAAIEAALRRKD